MKKEFKVTGVQVSLYALLIFVAVCFVGALSSCSSNRNEPTKPDVVVVPSEPVEVNKGGVKVISYSNFPENLLPKVKEAVEKAEEVKRSLCFREFMSSRDLIQTNNLSRDQVVYELINKGAEVKLEYYYKKWSKVSGYTYDGDPRIYLNGKYYLGMSVCDMASNIAHESSHKQGFIHDYYATKTRPYSVPYSINAAFKECCR